MKRDKVPVIPLLSLSSGGTARRREGQKGRLDELRVAEDAKRVSEAPPRSSGGRKKTATPGAELEKGAARRGKGAGRGHHVGGASSPWSSELRPLPPASSAASPLRPRRRSPGKRS